MAKQTILWTVLPYGRVSEGRFAGRFRISAMVAPRLTPESAGEQSLAAFPEFVDWPATLAGARFSLLIGSDSVRLAPLSKPDSALWAKLFDKQTPVAGFQFKDMSKVNLRSYALRNVLGFLRRHYGRLAVQSSPNHPRLLPWDDVHPDLKGMLSDLGTRTHTLNFGDRKIEVALPGFDRFYDEGGENLEARLKKDVFGPDSLYSVPVPSADAEEAGLPGQAGSAPLRVLPSDWYDPQPGGPGAPLLPQADAALMNQFYSADEYTFYQADRFYRREPASAEERAMRRPAFQNVPPPPQVPDYDFHRIAASLGDYPELLRRLGLVIDFALGSDQPIETRIAAGGGLGKGQMRLVIDWSNSHAAGEDQTPRTAWQADKERFVTRPRGSDLDRGLLRLEHADDGWGETPKELEGLFDLYQVDPDGAAVKTVGFTLSAQRLLTKSLSLRQVDGEVTYTTGDRQPVAALRSGGLGVSRHGRAAMVAQDAAAAELKNKAVESGNAGSKVVFFAEDVLKGYRVDVAPVPNITDPGRWHSLCAREGNYHLIKADEALDLAADEGHVSGASTTSTASEGVDPDDHYLHESLFRWTGWSLCAPRPGLTLRSRKVPDTELQAEEPGVVEDEATEGNGLRAKFKVAKGSLPKLRFGQLYRFRARVVDAAGNSLALNDPTLGDLEQASDAVGYWRFEPVDPPAMMQRSRLSEGESLERMVVRSNYNADPTAYLTTPDFATAIAEPASQDFEYTAENERHLAPPKASQQACEQHGLFDPYFVDPASIKKGYEIAAREQGTLYDPWPGAQVELITPAKLSEVAKTAALPPELPSPDNPVGDRLVGGQYVIHREAAVATPYLPDPMSGGVALRAQPGHNLPGVTGEVVLGPSCAVRRAPNNELVLLVTYQNDWPDSAGFRIVLAERQGSLTELPCAETFPDDGAPKWDENARTLTFFVAKGRIVRLTYASFAHPALVETFGVPQWTATAAERDFVIGMAVHGANWLLTPFRPLTLVHATQQPICLPELIKLSISRSEGAQHADLICRQVRLHGPSSGKFEIEAEWQEWVDELDKEAPERITVKGQLGEIQLPENHPNQFVLAEVVSNQNVDPERPRARADRHELGDTKFRLISYRVRATTRFREYLPPSLYADREKVTRLGPIALGPNYKVGAVDDPGAPVLPDPTGGEDWSRVPASAPPDDPRVLYVVPTFRWQKSESGAVRQVTRLGNGLRVWLDRPWFSSGDGELLGVVLYGDGQYFTAIPKQMQELVTQWGLDPLWETALPSSRTRVTDFPARVTAEAVKLRERPSDAYVQVVGHRVHWDDTRRLWYADIELNPGASYMPFVRLALVRYQPNALSSAKVSKVVLAEFSQVLPRRRAKLTRNGAQVSLSLYGATPAHGPMKFPIDSEYTDISFIYGPHETGRNRVELVLQTRNPSLDSDLAWKDFKVLGSEIVGGGTSGGLSTLPGGGRWGFFAAPAASAARGRRVELRAGGALTLEPTVVISTEVSIGVRPDIGIDIVNLLEPKIWEHAATLPGYGSVPARLMLREFERYYTDRTVPEKRGNAVHQRRVIEERLVYAAVFEL
jgi:hypothetical protein